MLGGKCVKCGSTKKLEIDHCRGTKDKLLSKNIKNFRIDDPRLVAELKKCQLLCRKCHSIKTILEGGKKLAKGFHGTVSSYNFCESKCALCRAAKAKYTREYRIKYGRR